jgi:nucleoside-diphosphate-sugar epimerase
MQLNGTTIAVTGATGFLGRYIVDTLLKRGAHVIGVVRNPERVPELKARGVELRAADLADRDRLLTGFHGADAVVSNAALFSLRNGRWDDHLKANIDGTRNVFEAIWAAGVKRAVHVSSVAVYRGRAQAKRAENHPQHSNKSPRRPWTVYAISKALSEQLAWRFANERGLDLTAIRPCAIYGAFDPNFTAVFKRLAAVPYVGLGLIPLFTRIPLVYAGDVAEAIALAFENPVAIGRAYNITGEDLTLRDFATAWRTAGGRFGSLKLPLPAPITDAFDNALAKKDLGWRNRPFVEALRETFALEGRSDSTRLTTTTAATR